MAAKGVVQMMKRIKNILKMTLIMTLVLTTFSGAVAVQAAGPRHDRPGWEQCDDRYRDHDRRDRDRRDHDKDWKRDHKSKTQEDADDANKKANWALGVAAVAAIIAIAK